MKTTGGGRTSNYRIADQRVTNDAVSRALVSVNGGGSGFAERQGYAAFNESFLGDGVVATEQKEFAMTYRGRNHDVYVNFTPRRPN